MKDRIHVAAGARDRCFVRKVPHQEVHLARHIFAASRGEIVETAHAVPGFQQRVRKMRSDEPSHARNEISRQVDSLSRRASGGATRQNRRSDRRRLPADPMLINVKLNRSTPSLRTDPSSYLRYSTLNPQQFQL
jgi:hypothetical protein